MQKAKYRINPSKMIAVLGLFTAIGVILNIFSGNLGTDFFGRISFVYFFCYLAGIVLGPYYGALVAAIADIIPALLFPQGTYMPLITLGNAAMAFIAGAAVRWLPIKGFAPKLLIGAVVAFVICSLGFSAAGETILYSHYGVPYPSVTVLVETTGMNAYFAMVVRKSITQPFWVILNLIITFAVIQTSGQELRRLAEFRVLEREPSEEAIISDADASAIPASKPAETAKKALSGKLLETLVCSTVAVLAVLTSVLDYYRDPSKSLKPVPVGTAIVISAVFVALMAVLIWLPDFIASRTGMKNPKTVLTLRIVSGLFGVSGLVLGIFFFKSSLWGFAGAALAMIGASLVTILGLPLKAERLAYWLVCFACFAAASVKMFFEFKTAIFGAEYEMSPAGIVCLVAIALWIITSVTLFILSRHKSKSKLTA